MNTFIAILWGLVGYLALKKIFKSGKHDDDIYDQAEDENKEITLGYIYTGNSTPAPETPKTPEVPFRPRQVKPFVPIDEQSFNSSLTMAKKLYKMLIKLDSNSDFIKEMRSGVSGIENLDKYRALYSLCDTRLTMMFLLDMYKCCVNLGYDFSRPTRENLSLVLLHMFLTERAFSISYATYKTSGSHAASNALEQLDNLKSLKEMTMGEDEFFLEKILEQYSTPLQKEYIYLLLEFCGFISHCSGKSSRWEKNYILRLRRKYLHEPASDSGAKTDDDSGPNEELDELIGLSRVKEEVGRLSSFIKIQTRRQKEGLTVPTLSYHCVFSGSPGTGKTTVARILADIYFELGVIKTNKLVETDRSGLVAEYVGQTAVKTNKVVDSAIDGVLFIDEAYSLSNGGNNDFGIEAIATLLKRMEDDRDRLIVILAGYEDDMQKFIETNPGLQSRFSRYIHFDDYSTEELMAIFDSMIKKHDYEMTDDARQALQFVISNAVLNKDKRFGNARYVRNLFERCLENQAARLSAIQNLTKDDLKTITVSDISA